MARIISHIVIQIQLSLTLFVGVQIFLGGEKTFTLHYEVSFFRFINFPLSV